MAEGERFESTDLALNRAHIADFCDELSRFTGIKNTADRGSTKNIGKKKHGRCKLVFVMEIQDRAGRWKRSDCTWNLIIRL